MNRLITATSVSLLASALLGATVHAADVPETSLKAQEASIQFLDQGSIEDWQANGEDGLWVQDKRKQWYYAKLMAPCRGLDYAVSLRFQTRSSNTFDRFSSVTVPNQVAGAPCALSSLVKSDAPPKKKGEIDGTAR